MHQYRRKVEEMAEFDREKLYEKTKKLVATGVVTEGYSTQLMEVLKPELLEVEEHYGRVRYPVQDWQRNAWGGLQGGQLASMLDNSIGINLVPRFGGVVSINMEISFLLPIGKNVDFVEVKTNLVKVGNVIVYVNLEAFLPDGSKAIDAVSNMMRVQGAAADQKNPQPVKVSKTGE